MNFYIASINLTESIYKELLHNIEVTKIVESSIPESSPVEIRKLTEEQLQILDDYHKISKSLITFINLHFPQHARDAFGLGLTEKTK